MNSSNVNESLIRLFGVFERAVGGLSEAIRHFGLAGIDSTQTWEKAQIQRNECYPRMSAHFAKVEYASYKVALPTIVAVGIFGNVMICYAFIYKVIRHRTNDINSLILMVLMMVTSDTTFILLALLLLTGPLVVPSVTYWVPIVFGLTHFARTASLLMSTMVVVDRYSAITNPMIHKANASLKRTAYIVSSLFTVSAIYSAPRFAELEIGHIMFCNESNIYEPVIITTSLRSNQIYRIGYIMTISNFLLFIIPLTIVLVLNVRIFISIRSSYRNRRFLTSVLPVANLNQNQRNQNGVAQYSTTLMLCIEGFVFLSCCALSLTMNIIEAFNFQWFSNETHFVLQHLTNISAVLNSVTNFFVFYVFGSQFREDLRSSFRELSIRRRLSSITMRHRVRWHSGSLQYADSIQCTPGMRRCTVPVGVVVNFGNDEIELGDDEAIESTNINLGLNTRKHCVFYSEMTNL